MNRMRRTALIIDAAVKAGKALYIQGVLDEDIQALKLKPAECHSNARKFRNARGGAIVRGWLVLADFYYVTHSIIRLDGILRDVTPLGAGPYRFVAASDVQGGFWHRKRSWSTVTCRWNQLIAG